MKEATGELNMTVITIVVLAALAVVAGTFVVPAITKGIQRQSCASYWGKSSNEVHVNGNNCCDDATNETNCVDISATT